MQTYKTRNETSEVSNKTSPITPRSSNASKTMTTTKPSPTKITTERSPRITQRWSPKTLVIEKTRSIKQSDLESQITHLQDELKRAKDELSSSKSSKKQLQQEVDEAKQQLTLMSTKLEEPQSHLLDFAWSGDGLEVHQKQNLVGEPAMNDIRKLKQQLFVEAELEVQDVSVP
ncbi:hypothetical protein HPP92_012058 [Vanilla planifolia]|uniref:Uncharacterized protein n=1 Tax=Vanilla planifolia TaxID=51239 RepID=A0A835R461_VANPL|nr:hypothetical protein HPP92_012058 [Vanilla planifolia]